MRVVALLGVLLLGAPLRADGVDRELARAAALRERYGWVGLPVSLAGYRVVGATKQSDTGRPKRTQWVEHLESKR